MTRLSNAKQTRRWIRCRQRLTFYAGVMPSPPTPAELEAFRRRIVAMNAYLCACLERLDRRGMHGGYVFTVKVRAAQDAVDRLAAYINGQEIADRFHSPGEDRLLRLSDPEPRANVWQVATNSAGRRLRGVNDPANDRKV